MDLQARNRRYYIERCVREFIFESIPALVSSLLKSSWISAEYVFGPNFYLIAHRDLSARPSSASGLAESRR
jgi:hypothetical protein